MRRWVWMAGVAAGLGCGGDGGPVPTTRRTCSQLGWVCGLDDYGSSCGSCGSGRACNAGTCVTAGCTPSCGGRTCGTESTCGSSCGTCESGQTCSASGACTTAAIMPAAHVLAEGSSPLFSQNYGVEFTVTVPSGRVQFSAESPSNDTFHIGVYAPDDWVMQLSGRPSSAVAYHRDVRTVTDSLSLPAGTYYLGFTCTNLIQRCAVRHTIYSIY